MPHALAIQKSLMPAPRASDPKDLLPSPTTVEASGPHAPAFNQALKDQTEKIKNPNPLPAAAKAKATATNGADAATPHGAADKPEAQPDAPHNAAEASTPVNAKSSKADGSKTDAAKQDQASLDPSHTQSLVAYVSQSQEQKDHASATNTAEDSAQGTGSDSPSTSPGSAPALGPGSPTATGAQPNESPQASTGATPAATPKPQSPNAQSPVAAKPDASASPTASASQAASVQTINTKGQANTQSSPSNQQSAQQDPSTKAPSQPKPWAFKDTLTQSAPSSDAPAPNPQSAAATPDSALPAVASLASIVTAQTPASSAPSKATPAASTPSSPIIAGSPAAPPTQTTSATSASAAQQSPASSHENVLDQVVLGLRGKLDPQNGKAEIRLDPPNMGSLKVSIALNKGSLTAQFETSTDVVRDLLSNHIDKLRSVLEGQGITVDRLAVQTQAQPQTPSQTSDQGSAGSSNHDGRSAGGFEQNRRGTQRDPTDTTFASTFQQARETAVPMDVLA
jgi:flagellar hook-length control protein FliK